MADDEDVTPQAGELTTANYGWVKPTVGASDDAWGGYLNTDLDAIDSTVKSVSNAIPAASSTTPVMSGAGAVGAGTTWARADHQHPSDTSRYAATNPSGYQTAAQVTAAVPVASSTTPVMDGIAAVGVGTTWARADHVHPTDAHALGDNRLINGDMRIDQRGVASGAGGTAGGYTVDRWQYQSTQASKGTWQRGAAVISGFPYALFFTSSSAYASIATDAFQITQAIEADAVSDFEWGTATAKAVTLSFWARSTLAGTFSGAIVNYTGTRSYPFTYSLLANTWTYLTITIPGDTTGTWVMSGNAGALYLRFDLGSGVNLRGPANAWASVNYMGATGAVSIVGTNGAVFYVTGVKLEIGSVATAFNRQSLTKSMADCQRYYSIGQGIHSQYGGAGANIYVSNTVPVTMRSTPTITPSNATSSNIGAITAGAYNGSNIYFNATVTALGIGQISYTYTATAEL